MDKKSIKKFMILMLCGFLCGVIGYITGKFLKHTDMENIKQHLSGLTDVMGMYIIPAVFVLFNIISITISAIRYSKTDKKFKSLKDDAEDELFEIESSLNLPVNLMNSAMIINFLFLSVIIEITEISNIEMSETWSNILCGTATITLIAGYIAQFIIIKKCIELVKKINPEKQGDILDINFQKKWENSSDEAQRLIMYKSAYKAFTVLNYLCMGLFILCIISQMVFKTGVMPIICVSVIWLVSTITYSSEAAKLEK